MVFAAAGLSAETNSDPCSEFPGFPEGSGSSSAYQFWPPGLTCAYVAPNGRTAIVLQDGHPKAFFAILATGLLLVLWRRSKLAIATALIFGAGGLGGFLFGFVQIPFVALWVGVPLALLTTRSLSATAIASVALAIGWMAQFFDDVPAVYAILLVIVAIAPHQAEVLSLRTLPD
jgi:hypothetical protein